MTNSPTAEVIFDSDGSTLGERAVLGHMTIVRGQSERKKTGKMMGLWSLFLPDATQVEVVTFPMPEMQDGLALGVWVKIQPHLLEDSTGLTRRKCAEGQVAGAANFGRRLNADRRLEENEQCAIEDESCVSFLHLRRRQLQNGQPECAADDCATVASGMELFNYDELTALQRDSNVGDADRVTGCTPPPDIESLCAETGMTTRPLREVHARGDGRHLLAELPARLPRHRRQCARRARRCARHRRLLAAAARRAAAADAAAVGGARPAAAVAAADPAAAAAADAEPAAEPGPAPPEPPAPRVPGTWRTSPSRRARRARRCSSPTTATPAVLPGTFSGKADLCVRATPPRSTDRLPVNLEAATSVVAQLRTATVYATRRSVRVVYQVFDAAGNTRVQPPFVRLHATKEGTCGTKDGPCVQQANCDRPDATSGIGECKLEVRPDFFSSDGDTTASLHLTLNRDELPPFATVSLAKATVGGWAPADNFVVGGALPAHPVYAGAETFDMELLAKSEAPSEEAGLATYQVDVWQVKLTWDPPEALSVERFAPSGSWLSQYTNPANLGDADGAGGVVLLVNEIKNARDANTYGSRLSLGKVTFRANDGFGGQQVAVVVTKQQMVAYSNGIVLGDADVDGPLLDATAGATVGSVLPTSPVALLRTPRPAPPRSARSRT